MKNAIKTNHQLEKAEAELALNLRASLSPSTMRGYETAIRRYKSEGGTLPADPYWLALYLSELNCEVSIGTVRVHMSAISMLHRENGFDNPFANSGVQKTIRGITRRSTHQRVQADGIDAEAYEAITDVAITPRIGRGGHMETEEMANFRGLFDVTLIGVMRDALLRRSEASALLWEDVKEQDDRTGRVLIRRSKTDQTGEGSVRFIGAPVMGCLKAMCLCLSDTSGTVFGISDRQINRRIQAATKAAGLKGRFSGHSPRIGMAQDLARFGCGLPELMEAGRWKSPAMPAYYLRSVNAGKGAVARYYSEQMH